MREVYVVGVESSWDTGGRIIGIFKDFEEACICKDKHSCELPYLYK